MPSIILIPGSFSPANFYYGIVKSLMQAGYEAVVYDLPSASRKPPARAATLVEDAAFFHREAEKLAGQGKEVVLVPHSYGGLVASECVKGLSRVERDAANEVGCVSKIIWLMCVIPPEGSSLQAVLGTLVPDFIKFDGDFMYHEPTGSAKVNLSDMPYERAIELASQFSYHSTESFSNVLTYAGYRYIPSAYIICDKDVVLPPAFQKGRVELVEKASGNAVKVLHCDSGHCPNLSKPDHVALLI
ncbi:hypothetical protein LTR53_002307 [Teratosphaeriaceae sp. CCFEE 6253]|nr:hypothetical protein LTR53_002307 [Teratosphaeriaceae sp. CCFEE 6253]